MSPILSLRALTKSENNEKREQTISLTSDPPICWHMMRYRVQGRDFCKFVTFPGEPGYSLTLRWKTTDAWVLISFAVRYSRVIRQRDYNRAFASIRKALSVPEH